MHRDLVTARMDQSLSKDLENSNMYVIKKTKNKKKNMRIIKTQDDWIRDKGRKSDNNPPVCNLSG